MKRHSKFLSLLTVAFVAMLALGACSDDDNGTGPTNNGPALMMDIDVGSYFDYNVWPLDENNQTVGDPVEYRVTYNTNSGLTIDGFDNFVYLKQQNRTTGVTQDQKDWVPMRVANNGDLFLHSFQHNIYNYFFELIKQLDSTVVIPPSVANGYKQWDPIGDFNDADGNANPIGYTWNISDTDIGAFPTINVNVGGFPLQVTVFPEITGIYDGVIDEKINLQNIDINQWQVRIFITMGVRASSPFAIEKDITLNQTLTFSDNPSAQITMTRETAILDLSDLGADQYVLPGEKWVLKAFVKN